MPDKIMDFVYSFGYDCQKWYNLSLYDENIIIWAAGSVITIYDIITNKKVFKRTSTGGSVGHIIRNPNKNIHHIAIGEGHTHESSPLIVIYELPSFSIVKELKDGTQCNYSQLDYSSDGKILASVGEAPDYNLTIWDWENACIKLRANASNYKVNNLTFSPFNQDQLITCGVNHIKFWKTSTTFTGSKLKDIQGLFGKTDVSDILGVLAMPDEKVLSGCSWGNILVWEGGIIKFEISRKGRKPCHSASITQFIRCPETREIITIGMDGHICTWHWDTVEQNDNVDGSLIELHPISEVIVPDTKIVQILERGSNKWFAQDASSGIWIIDFELKSEDSESEVLRHITSKKIINAHGGYISGFILFQHIPYILSLGNDGSILLHILQNGPTKTITKLKGSPTYLLHPPKNINKTGNVLIVGFSNGMIQVLVLNLAIHKDYEIDDFNNDLIICLQILKPHNKPITSISASECSNFLITAAEDSTIFIYDVEVKNNAPSLTPLYLISIPNIVTSISWKPSHKNVILLTCYSGFVIEGTLPMLETAPNPNKITTYERQFLESKIINLKGYCYYLKYTDAEDSDTTKIQEFPSSITFVNENNVTEIDLVIENQDSTKTNILWAMYDPEDSSVIWLAQEKFNCLLQLRSDFKKIEAFAAMSGNVETNITSMKFICNRHALLGMGNGELRMISLPTLSDIHSQAVDDNEVKHREKLLRHKTKKRDIEILSAFSITTPLIERLPIHDNIMGKITHIEFDVHKSYFYTAGGDGNIFAFKFNFEIEIPKKKFHKLLTTDYDYLQDNVHYNDEIEGFTHEEYVRVKRVNSLQDTIKQYKESILHKFSKIKQDFEILRLRNKSMPVAQQIPFFEEDRVQECIWSKLKDDLQIVHKRLAFPLEVSNLRLCKMMRRNVAPLDTFPFQVHSMQNSTSVKIIRQKKLPKRFFKDFEVMKEKIDNLVPILRKSFEPFEIQEDIVKINIIETEDFAPLIKDLPSDVSHPRPLAIAIHKYLERLEKKHLQEIEWREHITKNNSKASKELPKETSVMDDYCFKNQLDRYISYTPKHKIQLQTFSIRKEMFDIIHDFNAKVVLIRDEKLALIKRFNLLSVKSSEISNAFTINVTKSEIDLEYVESKIQINSEDDKLNLLNLDTNSSDAGSVLQSKACAENNQEYIDRYKTDFVIEQNKISCELKDSVECWERKYTNIIREREHVIMKAQFLKLHLLRLTMEQLILENFDSEETSMSYEIQSIQKEIMALQDQSSILQKEIDSKRISVLALTDQKKNIDSQIHSIINNNRYSEFLKQLFKKKFPQTKENEDSNSSNDSMSMDSISSSKEVDGNGLHLPPINLDCCPPGCDPQVYEDVIKFRLARYKITQKIREEQQIISKTLNNFETINENVKKISESLENKQRILKDLMNEKQYQLNNVECVVILSSEQCTSYALEDVRIGRGALIFPNAGIQDLKNRIDNLYKEAEEQDKIYSNYKIHLKRMEADCCFMNKQIEQFQDSIHKILEQKLGVHVHKQNQKESTKKQATKMLDSVLESMINNFKVSTSIGLSSEMHQQLSHWKKTRYELEQKYCSLLQEHTQKLQMAALLEKENFSLKKMLYKDKYNMFSHFEEEYQADVIRLQHIRKEQKKQIDDLQNEVQRLKLKPYTVPTLPPITPTNISVTSSNRVSPPFSEFPRNTSNTRMMALALAKELNDIDSEIFGKADSKNNLMSIISQMFPLLLEGKLNVNEAAQKIIETCKSSKISKFHNMSAETCHQAIADILSQITMNNLRIEDLEVILNLDNIKNIPGAEIEYVVQELLEASVSPDNDVVIDFAAAAIIELAPNIKIEKFVIDDIVQAILEDTDYESDQIQEMVETVIKYLKVHKSKPKGTALTTIEYIKQLERCFIANNQ